MYDTDEPGSDQSSVEDCIAEVQPHVDYCMTCQPYEGGEAVWILGNQQYMEEFLSDFDVPEEFHEEVASHLCCNNCGAALDMTCDVGTKSAAELEEERISQEYWAQWQTDYEPKLEDFIDFLSQYPYLGCNHAFGKHIFEEIEKFATVTIDDKVWWRARRPDGARTFLSSDLDPPDNPYSEGRYSHYGQRVFYLASTAEAAALEVLSENESLVWVQEYMLHNVTKVLDLGGYVDERSENVPVLEFGLSHTDVHRKPADPASPWKPQYFLPRFIADCARQKGCRGIRFHSPKHIHWNLVLFEWETSEVQPTGKPKIITLAQEEKRKAFESPF